MTLASIAWRRPFFEASSHCIKVVPITEPILSRARSSTGAPCGYGRCRGEARAMCAGMRVCYLSCMRTILASRTTARAIRREPRQARDEIEEQLGGEAGPVFREAIVRERRVPDMGASA